MSAVKIHWDAVESALDRTAQGKDTAEDRKLVNAACRAARSPSRNTSGTEIRVWRLRVHRVLHPYWADRQLLALYALERLVLEAVDVKRRGGASREPWVTAIRALWGEAGVERLDDLVGEGSWDL